MQLMVILNGTDTNPYHRWGLKQNPFPQITKYELVDAMNALNKLGAEPIPDTKFIQETLVGLFKEEFIKLCCEKFEKGKMVRFGVEFHE